jgi:hypothetical protein
VGSLTLRSAPVDAVAVVTVRTRLFGAVIRPLARRARDGGEERRPVAAMEERETRPLCWDRGGSRWRRRAGQDAEIVAGNETAMLIRVVLRGDLHIGSSVEVAIGDAVGSVEIRHIAPTGDPDNGSLVGVELVKDDDALAHEVAGLATQPDRWWWQRAA